mgnify:CR=1 FL=1
MGCNAPPNRCSFCLFFVLPDGDFVPLGVVSWVMGGKVLVWKYQQIRFLWAFILQVSFGSVSLEAGKAVGWRWWFWQRVWLAFGVTHVANSLHRVYQNPLVEIDVESDMNGRFSAKAANLPGCFESPQAKSGKIVGSIQVESEGVCGEFAIWHVSKSTCKN